MENNKISQAMDPDRLDLALPPLSESLRNQVIRHRPANFDLIGIIAEFLNVRVKLYQAAIAAMLILAVYFAFTEHSHQPTAKSSDAGGRMMVSVSNSTVLPSIHTFLYHP